MKNKLLYLIFLIATTLSYGQTNKLDQIKVLQIEVENTIENTEKFGLYFDLAFNYLCLNFQSNNYVDIIKTSVSLNDNVNIDNKEGEILQSEQGKLTKQGIILYFTIAIIVVILFFVYMLMKSLRQTREQKELVDIAKLEIEEKNRELIDSINYAKRIQLALLKEDEDESKNLPNHFILFQPKDILSGDFYWTYRIDIFWYIAAVDCTGHGVPGALLTMLGTAYLNEICAGNRILTPAEILDKLKFKITKELSQTGIRGESKDGMDMSLIRLNLDTNEIQWAGANNGLYFINNDGLQELKPDKQPIGYSDNPRPFTNHFAPLKVGDSLYLFSDGYADQFGGEKGKKFKYSNFKKILIETDKDSPQNQKEKLLASFKKWQGELEQLDDVCVIGVRI
jgi:serine phosphatase RsbU (regulator of sigma subunit)